MSELERNLKGEIHYIIQKQVDKHFLPYANDRKPDELGGKTSVKLTHSLTEQLRTSLDVYAVS